MRPHRIAEHVEISAQVSVGLRTYCALLRHWERARTEDISSKHVQHECRINGLTGKETNPDTTDEPVKVRSAAAFQGQLDPDPDHHFPAVHKQLFYGTDGPPAKPSMQGFIQSYFDQQRDVEHSRKILYYFKTDKLPVLHTLARSYAVFNGWFCSIPGPTICNRAFAHYGTSFGQVSLNVPVGPIPITQGLNDKAVAQIMNARAAVVRRLAQSDPMG